MEFVVLLKQAPATDALIQIAPDGAAIRTEDISWVINPYDEFAVEEALRLREAHGGSVTIVSAGWEKAAEAIRTALAMGADRGILITDPGLAALDGLGLARVLAAAIQPLNAGVILAGQRAVDDEGYLVGPAVAEYLGIPVIPLVIQQTVQGDRIRCRRTVDGGAIEVETPLPVLLTTQRGLNEPRYASLPGIMKAKKKVIEKKSLADLGLSGDALPPARTTVRRLSVPPARQAGIRIQGDSPQAMAADLVQRLHTIDKVI